MNKQESIKQLEALKKLYSEADTIETKEKDIDAFNIAIEALREAVQESKAHEQLCNIYTKELTLVGKIDDDMATLEDYTIIDSSEAIKIDVKINSSKYYKEEVYESINVLCEQIKKYFR